jgi:hypothetical protein
LLPPSLWRSSWTPPVTSGEINVQDGSEAVKGLIFDQAQRSGHRPSNFRLAGSSTSDLAQKLVEAIKMALKNDNFENILSPTHEFTV